MRMPHFVWGGISVFLAAVMGNATIPQKVLLPRRAGEQAASLAESLHDAVQVQEEN